MSLTLQQIDDTFTTDPCFHAVSLLTIDESGVDPIGMRQLNLDLMDATVPGINNVTVHLRPYAFMAWAWWKARTVLTENGMVEPERMRDIVLRYEAMYAWAHSLVERPFRGAAAIRRHLPLQGAGVSFCFHGQPWEDLKGDMTSLMAPTEYGPSIKALRWLAPMEGGTFRITKEALPAVEAIDRIVAAHVPRRLLARAAPTVNYEDVLPFAEHLAIDQATSAERAAFIGLFHDLGTCPDAPRDLRRRMATIDLLRALLSEVGQPIGLPEIRRRLSQARSPARLGGDGQELLISVTLLAVLQARQLQRLATEAVMLWVESNLSRETARALSSDDLAIQADAAARDRDVLAARARTVGDYMDQVESLGSAMGWPDAASAPETDVVDLMEDLHRAQGKDLAAIPGLALRAFAVVRAVAQSIRSREVPKAVLRYLDGRQDRLPFGVLENQIEALRGKELVSFWRQVIETWVIGQHVHWSAVRGGDGKKRLQIGLEGSGWIRVRPHMSARFGPTPDRLYTLLSLGAECGLFATAQANDGLHFSA